MTAATSPETTKGTFLVCWLVCWLVYMGIKKNMYVKLNVTTGQVICEVHAPGSVSVSLSSLSSPALHLAITLDPFICCMILLINDAD